MIAPVQSLLDQLRTFLEHPSRCDDKVLMELSQSYIQKEDELLAAYIQALLSKKKKSTAPLSLTLLESGAFPLLSRGGFSWKGLPYPALHAELACLLIENDRETAKRMARWQKIFATDHLNSPIRFLFAPDRGFSSENLENWHQKLLSIFPEKILQDQAVDEELGLAIRKTENSTLVVASSGCKSGCGCFLANDCGIINYGPQKPPLGDCESFGLAGRSSFFSSKSLTDLLVVSSKTHCAAPHSRETGFAWLKDSSYSGQWLVSDAELKKDSALLSFEMVGSRARNPWIFSFFGKGPLCTVQKTHRLHPCSLDRYLGPAQLVTFEGAKGKVVLENLKGSKKMEVIPLAGNDAFWGADFLVAFTPNETSLQFSVTVQG